MTEDADERRRRQSALDASDAPPHPVFDFFHPWRGRVEPGWDVNFLGVRTRVAFFSLYEQLADFSQAREIRAGLPIPNEDYFEWIALLESVRDAEGAFTMVELGAGWGKWLVSGIAALRQGAALPYHVVGVESEPTHFKWMRQHMADNDVDLRHATLIQAAVAGADGHVWFHVGAAADWYGQAIAAAPEQPEARGLRALLRRRRGASDERTVKRVPAVSVRTVLEPLERVDLIDVDIQGAEADALEPAAAVLDAKVKRVYVATHDRENEERLRTLFAGLGWSCQFDYPGNGESETAWGRVMFEDGAQVWRNTRL
jgi:FkbM family methyltransferase